MVAGMIKKWRPWPPLPCKKVEAKIVVNRVEGFSVSEKEMKKLDHRLSVEVRWKGSKGNALRALRRSVRRNFTKGVLSEDGTAEWNEEFVSVCNFLGHREDGSFHPWEVSFTVFRGYNGGGGGGIGRGSKNKVEVVATAFVNLTEFASQTKLDIRIPLTVSSSSIICCNPILCLSVELRAAPLEVPPNTIMPIPFSPSSDDGPSLRKPESSALKAGMRKVKIFTCYGQDGSVQNDDAEVVGPFDAESLDDDDQDEEKSSEEVNEDSNLQIVSSCRSLAYKNVTEALFYSNASHVEADLVYYSNRRSETVSTTHVNHESLWMIPRRRFLLWKKRKLSFKSTKVEGEPLLKKQYAEEGGDDIDLARRQLTNSHASSFMPYGLPHNEFGDDYFAVGKWEDKEVISRDGQFKLRTQVFFASIDQMSEKAAGESACTALVAIIADWFQLNTNQMPIKSQLDGLIREGSLEWRNLRENEAYRERFSDGHFDLETVLEAKIRPLRVVPEKSFIGFFHPEGIEEDKGEFNFLDDAMSFDSIWEEINSDGIDDGEQRIYIISWNDHFFVLKVDKDAYHIIDTLGERLHEGCNQAYVLKFDKNTNIISLPAKETESQPTEMTAVETEHAKEAGEESENSEPVEEETIVCSGKESCREYIKCFLAAIPIRELQVDIKKGLTSATTSVHQRLQIEFHLTERDLPVVQSSSVEETVDPLVVSMAESSEEE